MEKKKKRKDNRSLAFWQRVAREKLGTLMGWSFMSGFYARPSQPLLTWA